MTKIAILGTGGVGQALTTGLRKNGYEVVMGTAHPDKKIEWKDASLTDTPITSYRDAAGQGEIIVFAVKGIAAEDVAREISAELSGKVVIDTTNPIAGTPPENGVLKFFTSLDESLMEKLQRSVPSAKFVKAFNSVGNALMVNPDFGSVKPTMFICGNDAEAKIEVTKILEQFGWDVADMGGVEAARAIEPLCILWCIPGLLRNEWSHAFKLLRK